MAIPNYGVDSTIRIDINKNNKNYTPDMEKYLGRVLKKYTAEEVTNNSDKENISSIYSLGSADVNKIEKMIQTKFPNLGVYLDGAESQDDEITGYSSYEKELVVEL